MREPWTWSLFMFSSETPQCMSVFQFGYSQVNIIICKWLRCSGISPVETNTPPTRAQQSLCTASSSSSWHASWFPRTFLRQPERRFPRPLQTLLMARLFLLQFFRQLLWLSYTSQIKQYSPPRALLRSPPSYTWWLLSTTPVHHCILG